MRRGCRALLLLICLVMSFTVSAGQCVGKFANPLTDIRNTRRIHAVVVNGRLLNRRALDALLRDAAVGLRGPTPR